MNGCPNKDCEFNKTYDFIYGVVDINFDRPYRTDSPSRVSLCFPQLDYENHSYVYITSNEAQLVSEEAWNRWLLEHGISLTPASKECPFCGLELEPPGKNENIKDRMNEKNLKKIEKLEREVGDLESKLKKLKDEFTNEFKFSNKPNGHKERWLVTDITAKEFIEIYFPHAKLINNKAILSNGAVVELSDPTPGRVVELILVDWK